MSFRQTHHPCLPRENRKICRKASNTPAPKARANPFMRTLKLVFDPCEREIPWHDRCAAIPPREPEALRRNMNTSIVLQARHVQAPIFSPRLQQAVRLLQMSSQEYAQALRDAAELNPFLEIEPLAQEGHESIAETVPAAADAAADIEAAAAFDRITAAPASGDRHLSHDESFDLMQRVPLPDSLRAHLHGQLGVLRISAREMAFARAVVEALDDDGYLRISLEEVGSALGETGADAERELRTALRRVQALDPRSEEHTSE